MRGESSQGRPPFYVDGVPARQRDSEPANQLSRNGRKLDGGQVTTRRGAREKPSLRDGDSVRTRGNRSIHLPHGSLWLPQSRHDSGCGCTINVSSSMRPIDLSNETAFAHWHIPRIALSHKSAQNQIPACLPSSSRLPTIRVSC